MQKQELEEAIRDTPKILVLYGKENCTSCDMTKMALGRVNTSGWKVVHARMEDLGEDHYKEMGLRQVPTLIAYKDGKESARQTGFALPNALSALVR